MTVEPDRLQASWARVVAHGDAVPAYFYAALFTRNPQLRPLFPASMAGQRDRLVTALGRIVAGVGQPDVMLPFARGLGRDHRRFDVRPEHYPPVGEALLATLSQFLGPDWDADLAAGWTEAYGLVAQVMCDAAAEATRNEPPYWKALVVEHERRGLDVAVVRLQVDQPVPYWYLPGQSCAIEVPTRLRLWRYYSPANIPRRDGLVELHVKAVPGGEVSTAIVQSLRVGDETRVGAPIGHSLTLDPDSGRDLLLLAGGTGLAPLKALTEQLAAEGGRRRVTLVVGGRTSGDLYDLPALESMAQQMPWLTVVPTLSHDAHAAGVHRGTAVDVALRMGRWDTHDIYVCGPAEMVATSRERLAEAGIAPQQIRSEDGTNDPYRPDSVATVTVADRAEVYAR